MNSTYVKLYNKNVLFFSRLSFCSMKVRQSMNVHNLYFTLPLNIRTHSRITKHVNI